VFGYSAEEYRSVAKKAVEAGADAVELNVSCPHVKDTGSEIGQDISELGNVVRKAKSAIDKPVFVKLSPNVTSMAESAEVAVKAGADGLTIMNTVKAMALNIETRMPVLANKVGGLSGPAIKPIALRCVYEVYQRVHVPLIGCGGITDWRDAVEFLLAGASALQIATAVSQEGIGVFGKISLGIQRYLEENQFEKVEDIVGLSHRR
jgi:dihydroorotate dehydrogenase (NAD+) catalytic subunit